MLLVGLPRSNERMCRSTLARPEPPHARWLEGCDWLMRTLATAAGPLPAELRRGHIIGVLWNVFARSETRWCTAA